MHISTWKKYWSYLFEIRIEETNSEFHPLLAVILKNNRFQLCCSKAIYSYDDKYDNFYQGFKKVNFDKLKIKKVLVLGLGLASIPYILEKSFGFEFSYTIVEIDSEVIRLASKYTLPRLNSYIEIIHADAINFVEISNKKYDLIAVDLFAEDIIPKKFQTKVFFSALANRLNPNGLIMYNRLASLPKDLEESRHFFEKFKAFFPNAVHHRVADNWMIYQDKGAITR